jgi:hypothetical protein
MKTGNGTLKEEGRSRASGRGRGKGKNRGRRNPATGMVKIGLALFGPLAAGFGLRKADINWSWWQKLKARTRAFLCAVVAAAAKYFQMPELYGAFAALAGQYVGQGQGYALVKQVEDKAAGAAQGNKDAAGAFKEANKGTPDQGELEDAADDEFEEVRDFGALTPDTTLGDTDDDDFGDTDDDDFGDPDDDDFGDTDDEMYAA